LLDFEHLDRLEDVEAMCAAAEQDDVAGTKRTALEISLRLRVEVDLEFSFLNEENFLREVHFPRHLVVAMRSDALALGTIPGTKRR
jgi:hypothetical protein